MAIKASAETPAEAATASAEVLSEALTTIDALRLPYAARAVTPAADDVRRVSADVATVVAVIAFVSLVVALLAQQVTATLGQRWRGGIVDPRAA